MRVGELRAKTQCISLRFLRFRAVISSYHRRQVCNLGYCVAKTLRFCVCIWKATKSRLRRPPPLPRTWLVLRSMWVSYATFSGSCVHLLSILSAARNARVVGVISGARKQNPYLQPFTCTGCRRKEVSFADYRNHPQVGACRVDIFCCLR